MSNLQKTLKRLYQNINLEKKLTFNYNEKSLRLDTLSDFLNRLNNPHLKYETIHIAGTKGKGSTANYLKSILVDQKYKVGLYTSPHLIDERERIGIDNNTISWVDFVLITNQIMDLAEKTRTHLTFFDILTSVAFVYFARKKVEIAIIEVGLGGRLDSTNVVQSKASVITQIDFDHMDKLGNTLAKIAYEKAGIIKPNQNVFVLDQNSEIIEVIQNKSKEKNANCLIIDPIKHKQYKSIKQFPKHQKINYFFAVSIYENLYQKKLSEKNLNNALSQTTMLGRYQKYKDYLIDVAHNPIAMRALVQSIEDDKSISHYENRAYFVFCRPDKNIEQIASIIPTEEPLYYFKLYLNFICIKDLENSIIIWKKIRTDIQVINRFEEIVNYQKKNNALCVITGSFYFAGAFLKWLENIEI